MQKIVTQKPYSSKPQSFEQNVGAVWRQFITEVLVRHEVKSIHSWEVVPTGKGTFIILVLANISTTKQWEEADPFLVEEYQGDPNIEDDENTKTYIGYARVPNH